MSVKERMKAMEEEASKILNPEEEDETEKLIEAAGEAAEKNPHFNPEGELMEKVKEIEEATDVLIGNKH
ncbi:MAG: hypothetical protein Q4C17_02160 [Bacillota bacterium]|nr:hypothetical protein [Bacillota bacterium]MDD6979674.1 hypothetical protein [Bacillota bacterium]MDO4471953.1 hypothetical protein [Bacillota bacterium]MDY6174727.1 hypothetical protein [Lentihominibacter sp.]